MALHPRLGIGQAYMDGRVSVEQGDIFGLIDLIRSNAPWGRRESDREEAPAAARQATMGSIGRFNSRQRSRRNVAHHYDLSDRLYDLFLDADRQYSCAYFTDPNNGPEQAQTHKKAHIAAKLNLRPGSRTSKL